MPAPNPSATLFPYNGAIDYPNLAAGRAESLPLDRGTIP